ncbi:hypothetical protein [Vibrio mediterranei]|uniref:hypothetical protein n=1 Tax=Vibrio mediterranei TaxID=689 RepID=UPI00148B514F|nr:hypothetical protein [Vibrio mediterranei]NOH29031.1 hypothetical protein [Vibrio mediterranei]
MLIAIFIFGFFLSTFRITGALTLSYLLLFAFLLTSIIKMKRVKVKLVDLFPLLLLIKFIVDFANGNVSNSNITNYISLLFFWSCYFMYRNSNIAFNLKHINLFLNLSIAHAFLLIFQFALFNLFDNFTLLNPFGNFSAYGPDPQSIVPSAYNPALQIIRRPNGLNWEPSAAGFWGIFALVTLINYSNKVKNFKFKLLIITLGTLSTFSFLAIVTTTFLITIFLLKQSKHRNLFRVILVITIVPSFIYFGTEAYNLLSLRLGETSIEGSSGFIRVAAPLSLFHDGVGIIGNAFLADKAYQLLPQFDASGRNEFSGIANTYLEYLYYFGVAGGFMLICLIRETYTKTSLLSTIALSSTLIFGGYLFNPIYFYSALIFLALQSSENFEHKSNSLTT